MTLRFPTRLVAAVAIGSIASLALAQSGAGQNPQRRPAAATAAPKPAPAGQARSDGSVPHDTMSLNVTKGGQAPAPRAPASFSWGETDAGNVGR